MRGAAPRTQEVVAAFATRPEGGSSPPVVSFAIGFPIGVVLVVDAAKAADGASCSGFDALAATLEPSVVGAPVAGVQVLPAQRSFTSDLAASGRDEGCLVVFGTLAAQPPVPWATPRRRVLVASTALLHGRGLPIGEVLVDAGSAYGRPGARGRVPDGIAHSRLRVSCDPRVDVGSAEGQARIVVSCRRDCGRGWISSK